MQKKSILSLFIICLSISCLGQQHIKLSDTVGVFLNKTAQNCGGFTVSSVIQDKSAGEKAIIYGSISHCIDKEQAVFSIIVVYNEANKKIDTIRTDRYGRYKKAITPGRYKIWAGQPIYGSIETTLIDFNPETSTELNLYLAIDPPIID